MIYRLKNHISAAIMFSSVLQVLVLGTDLKNSETIGPRVSTIRVLHQITWKFQESLCVQIYPSKWSAFESNFLEKFSHSLRSNLITLSTLTK